MINLLAILTEMIAVPMTRPKRVARQLRNMEVELRDTTEVELTLKQIPVRETETDEVTTAWQVEHPNLESPCRGDTPREALDIFGACVESDDEGVAIDLDELAED